MGKKKLYFTAIVIGNGEFVQKLVENKEYHSIGLEIQSYISTNENEKIQIGIEKLGNLEKIRHLVELEQPDDIIIAVDLDEHEKIHVIVEKIAHIDTNVKIIPELYEHYQGRSEISSLMGESLIGIPTHPMTQWEYNLKVFIDYMFSFIAIVLLSPLYLFIFLGVKLTSKGSALYKQERIGRHGYPFILYKFRSMYTDAEKDGPGLSRKHDNRITPFGSLLRKTKLDEIPNFFNVLKGDMSLVGPRPERKFFINQIIKVAPNYRKLQKVKPGITSIGQVKYGYAENVDQMIKRLRYDLIYLENMSIWTDFKIIFYTVRLLFKGRHI